MRDAAQKKRSAPVARGALSVTRPSAYENSPKKATQADPVDSLIWRIEDLVLDVADELQAVGMTERDAYAALDAANEALRQHIDRFAAELIGGRTDA